MDLIPSETSLVVAGSWNAAILTPAWMLQHGFNRAAGEPARVQVFLPAVQGAVFDFPRFSLDEFSYVVRPDALLIAPSESTEERFASAEQVTARVVRVLAHTPVTGIGHNFEFRDGAPTPQDVAVFTGARQDLVDQMPGGWAPAGAVIASVFKNEAETVHVSIQRQWDGGAISVKFNFHHPIANTDQAIAVLEGTGGYARMSENLDLARRVITSLYRRD
jgi:hypothetical protein